MSEDADGASARDTDETSEEEGEPTEGLTYADAGVDIDASEAATAALVGAVGEFEGDYAGLVDLGDRYLALATDGVGTKLLVAEALDDYSTIGIDCIAMNVNDLIATGVTPVAFVDYLAVEAPDDRIAEEVGEGLADGAARAEIALVGGETAVMPDVIRGLDLAGACAGVATESELFDGTAREGDLLVGLPSSGIHSNGLTLAREAATRNHDYTDPFPWDDRNSDDDRSSDDDRTIGEVLLEPTRIYREVLAPLHAVETHAAAHVTGGGWTNLSRMGEHRYVVDDPFEPQPIFELIQEEGGVSDAEMHRTFNMGTGFVAALPEPDAESVVAALEDARVIGHVEAGDAVEIRGLSL